MLSPHKLYHFNRLMSSSDSTISGSSLGSLMLVFSRMCLMFCSSSILFSGTDRPVIALHHYSRNLATDAGSFDWLRAGVTENVANLLAVAGLKMAPANNLPKFITVDIINKQSAAAW